MRTSSFLSLLILTGALALAPLDAGASSGPVHFTECASMTGRTATIVIPGGASFSLGGDAPEAGDEIAVYTPAGTCAGVAVWNGGPLAVAVWEEDEFGDPVGGMTSGEQLHFRAYRKSTGDVYGAEELPVSVVFDPAFDTGGTYSPDAIFVIQSLVFAPPSDDEDGGRDAVDLLPAYPNPFASSTTLEYVLDAPGNVQLELLDIVGRRIAVLVDEFQPAGRHEVRFQAPQGLASGLLIARLQAGTAVATRRLTLMR